MRRLAGLDPLYKDYEWEYYWFEIPKFLSTLVLCGFVTLMPFDGASRVFISLAVSVATMMLFANCQPYLSRSDDTLGQFCQLSLTLTMAVGLLEKAAQSFQDNVFGVLLVVSTTTNLLLGLVVISYDFLLALAPEKMERAMVAMSAFSSCAVMRRAHAPSVLPIGIQNIDASLGVRTIKGETGDRSQAKAPGNEGSVVCSPTFHFFYISPVFPSHAQIA